MRKAVMIHWSCAYHNKMDHFDLKILMNNNVTNESRSHSVKMQPSVH